MDGVKVAASLLNATGSITSGISRKRLKKAEAQQQRQNADAIQAAGTRQAYEQRRSGERMKSDAAAINAASGGGMDAAMIERMARIESDTDYNVLASIYSADTDASAMRYAAKLSEMEGRAAEMSGYLSAIPSILDVGDNIFGPKASVPGVPLTGQAKAKHKLKAGKP